MGLFSRFKGKTTDKAKVQMDELAQPLLLPIFTPSPYMDPRNARPTNMSSGQASTRVWNHTYGEYGADDILNLIHQEPFTNSIIRTIKERVVRRGFEWKQKYAGYCARCKVEFSHLPDPEDPSEEAGDKDKVYLCPECGDGLEIPKESEFAQAVPIIDHPMPQNPFMSFEDMVYMMMGDVLQLGNGYLIAIMEYPTLAQDVGEGKKGQKLEVSGTALLSKKVRGFYYVSEKYVKKVIDDYGNPGGKYWCCLKCRQDSEYKPETSHKPCKCGRATYPVHVIVSPTRMDQGEANRFYIEGEYWWTPFDEDSLTYSFAPGASLGKTIETLYYLTIDMLRLYKDRRTPPMVKWVKVSSMRAYDQWLDHMRTTWKQGDEAWIGVDTETSGPPVGVEKTTFTPQEMGSLEYVEQLQNLIAIFYGITPSERGSKEGGSGLGNQSKDITISVRNISQYQDRLNEGVLKWFVELFGIKGWKYVHIPPERDDLQRQAERNNLQMDVAKKALELGARPKMRKGTEDLEVVIEGDFYTPEEYWDRNNMFSNPFENTGEKDWEPGKGKDDSDYGGPDSAGAPPKKEGRASAKQ